MRSALIRAAIGDDGSTASLIMAAAKRIKPRKFGGWNVIRGGKKRGRRNRKGSVS
jgi:hypothetical protein